MELVPGRQISVEYQKRDKYGRIVGRILVVGVDVCLEQVNAGFAWMSLYFLPYISTVSIPKSSLVLTTLPNFTDP